MIDNSALVAPFASSVEDGDTFIYTELLDRSKQKGNNKARLMRSFYHRSQAEFWEQWPTIKEFCDKLHCRAYTRLAPRSFKKVGKINATLVLDAALTDNWAGMKTLYLRACGTVTPNEKLWLFDVDIISEHSMLFGSKLVAQGDHVATIPSRKGLHYIARPFHIHGLVLPEGVSLHKDNPTNLYIPDEAA